MVDITRQLRESVVVSYESHKSCAREGSYRVDFSADQTQPLLAFVVRFFSISSTSTMEEIFPSDKARLEAMTSVCLWTKKLAFASGHFSSEQFPNFPTSQRDRPPLSSASVFLQFHGGTTTEKNCWVDMRLGSDVPSVKLRRVPSSLVVKGAAFERKVANDRRRGAWHIFGRSRTWH